MKYFYAATLLFILASCQKDEKAKAIDHSKTDWAFYQLKGNVKTLSTKSWQLNEQLQKVKPAHEQASIQNCDMEFSEDGQLTSERFYMTDAPIQTKTYNGREKLNEDVQYMDGKPVIKTSYEWDASGKNNTAIIRRNGDNSEIDHIKREFHNGKLAKATTLNAQNSPTETTTYIHDSKGNLIEEDFFLTTNTVQYKTIHKYDKKNRKVSETSYTASGKKNYETLSNYEGNNLVRKFTVNEKGETEYSEEYTYDKKGNILTKLTFEKFDNTKTLDRFMYDENGNKTSWQILRNEVPLMAAQYIYDDHNNPTSIIATDGKNKVIDKREYSYNYDKKGNWVKKTVKIHGTPQFVVERVVTYYN